MHIRAQRIGGEAILPQPWGELSDIGRRVLSHALKHIDQVVIGIDAMQPAGDDQARFARYPPQSLVPTGVSARIAVAKPDIRNGVSCGSDPSPQEHIHVYGYLPDEFCSSRLAD